MVKWGGKENTRIFKCICPSSGLIKLAFIGKEEATGDYTAGPHTSSTTKLGYLTTSLANDWATPPNQSTPYKMTEFYLKAKVSGGGEVCFAAGTLITMYDSTYKPIEEIKIGDMVFTQLGNEEVLEVFSPIHNGILEYTFSDGTKTKNTADHPYYVIDKGWCSNVPIITNERYGIKTNEFVLGDICVDDSDKQIELVSIEKLDGDFQTYTFSTDSKTYYANKILVHSEV